MTLWVTKTSLKSSMKTSAKLTWQIDSPHLRPFKVVAPLMFSYNAWRRHAKIMGIENSYFAGNSSNSREFDHEFKCSWENLSVPVSHNVWKYIISDWTTDESLPPSLIFILANMRSLRLRRTSQVLPLPELFRLFPH